MLESYLLVIVLTLILFMTGSNLVAMLIAEEKEKKTGSVLITSPARPADIVWGKTLTGTLYIILISALIILINGGMSGNWPLALTYLVISLPAALSVGVLIGSWATSAKQCNGWMGLAMILFLVPSWFITLLKLPEPFGSILQVIPSQYLVMGLHEALTEQATQATITTNLSVWTVFTVVLAAAAYWRIRTHPQSVIA